MEMHHISVKTKSKFVRIFILILLLVPFGANSQEPGTISEYVNVLEEEGQDPVDFVNSKLDQHDLIVFDDALHLALEPFEFYQQLINDKTFISSVNYIFVELFSITAQPYIDEFLNNSKKDFTILRPVFQNDFSGYGLRYQTYLDLMSSVWDANQPRSDSEKIKVIGVDQPIYWEGIRSRVDYDLFQESLIGRDYFMYKKIVQKLNNFESGDKGIFLTNTRHAYKNIRKSDGTPYWNTGTFLNLWHPGKSYSIRLHNMILSIESERKDVSNASTEGLDRISYSWIKMEDGVWDAAFEESGNNPLAIPLRDNVFGKAKYVGNHMLKAADGQTMYDAYDGLIFLAPLEDLHFTARFDFIFTSEFKEELKRRILILQEGRLDDFLAENEVTSLEDFIEELSKAQGITRNSLVPSD